MLSSYTCKQCGLRTLDKIYNKIINMEVLYSLIIRIYCNEL